MKIILATGIYPPDIGGPATYVRALAKELKERGVEVVVVTYGTVASEQWPVVGVSKFIPVIRWFLYAKALRKHAKDADAVIAFSSVSCGVPLWIAHLKKPKNVLRLGGDFFWERYTACGGKRDLHKWCTSKGFVNSLTRLFVKRLLFVFDHIIFSTRFQEKIYEGAYKKLPSHSVIENALPSGVRAACSDDPVASPTAVRRERGIRAGNHHEPFRLLFMGRFVGFKNLPALIESVSYLQDVKLTLVGDGPTKRLLVDRFSFLVKNGKIRFVDSAHGEEKQKIFSEHDLMVIPSITEISPNVALEARMAGLPVLLTQETGLSSVLTQGMIVKDLSTPEKIAAAVTDAMQEYDRLVNQVAESPPARSYADVGQEFLSLLQR